MHLLRYSRKIALVLFLVTFAFISTRQTVANQGGEPGVRLLWSCGALLGQGSDQRLIAVDKTTVMHAGDQLKFYFEPQTDCYIYFLYYSSQGDLHLLFPSRLSSPKLSPGMKHYIPSEKGWFELDEVTGVEKFYLLASASKLEKFESLYQNHLQISDPADIKASIDSIFSEMKKLKRQHRTLSTVAERPARIGGGFRSVSKTSPNMSHDISRLAREISSTRYYSRTFTIDHQ